jgi:predicted CoA-binding protein
MNTPITFILGATPNPERYSFIATALLVEKGYAVYPFGIKKGAACATPSLQSRYADLAAVKADHRVQHRDR